MEQGTILSGRDTYTTKRARGERRSSSAGKADEVGLQGFGGLAHATPASVRRGVGAAWPGVAATSILYMSHVTSPRRRRRPLRPAVASHFAAEVQ